MYPVPLSMLLLFELLQPVSRMGMMNTHPVTSTDPTVILATSENILGSKSEKVELC